jgi:hypothetical protein
VVTAVGPENYPETTVGRVATVFLMVLGVGLFGLVAGALASSFLFSDARTRAADRGNGRPDGRADLTGPDAATTTRLAARLSAIERELAALRAMLGPEQAAGAQRGRVDPEIAGDGEIDADRAA